ncbi:hypothetical protein [Variovorax boronicumulans]|uniref:hypothetical protein n=1 Tax=Variovorax boronicumulans TaxID=436515 RepID=UPI000BB3A9A4|nr:hypothetical protein [Variovorax boronicumulans]
MLIPPTLKSASAAKPTFVAFSREAAVQRFLPVAADGLLTLIGTKQSLAERRPRHCERPLGLLQL